MITKTAKRLFEETLKQLKEERHEHPILSGFPELDKNTGGWRNGDLIVVAARPAMGKTAFVLTLARNAATQFNKPVAFFSIDLAPFQIAIRLIAAETEIEMPKIVGGDLHDEDFEKMDAAAKQLANIPLFIDDAPTTCINELCNEARVLYKQHDIKMIVIDNLQNISVDKEITANDNGDSYYQPKAETSYIMRELKKLVKELHIPIILTSGIIREGEEKEVFRPQLWLLRKMGIEQYANVIAFLYRPEYYGLDKFEDGESARNIAEIYIAKNNRGYISQPRLLFCGHYAKFKSITVK